MRQCKIIGEHFRRGNADGRDNQDERAAPVADRREGVARP